MNGIRASRRATSAANSMIQRAVSPKMSSANQMWSGRTSELEPPHLVRDVRGSLGVARPKIGFAHQLQPNGQPRDVTMFQEKRPCARVHAVAVRLDVDQVPRRQGQGVEVRDARRGRRSCRMPPSGRAERESGDRVERRVRGVRATLRPARESSSASPSMTASAPAARYGAGWSVASEPFTATRQPRARRGDHLERRLAGARRAHLRQEIEIVLEDADDGRPHAIRAARRTRRRSPASIASKSATS